MSRNRLRLFQAMRQLEVFTEHEIRAEMQRDGGSLVIDSQQTIRACLEELSDIGVIERQNDYYFIR